jgi:hypothetical protein
MCVSCHNYVCKEFLSYLSTTDNVLKIAVCGSSKKFYLSQVCALQLLAFDSSIFQCAVYGGLWLLMCVEGCDKIVQSMISQHVAGVTTSMLR